MVRGIRRVVGAGPSGADDVRHGATLAGGRLEDAMGRQLLGNHGSIGQSK